MIPDKVNAMCPRLLVNREAVKLADKASDTSASKDEARTAERSPVKGSADRDDERDLQALMSRWQGAANSGFRFHLGDNYRDVFCEVSFDTASPLPYLPELHLDLQGDCDAGIQALLEAAGWADEFAARFAEVLPVSLPVDTKAGAASLA
jgi:hypothetical protein